MEGECYDYDADIDELFLLATKIICPASMGYEEVLIEVCLLLINFLHTCSLYCQHVTKLGFVLREITRSCNAGAENNG